MWMIVDSNFTKKEGLKLNWMVFLTSYSNNILSVNLLIENTNLMCLRLTLPGYFFQRIRCLIDN